jgi:hypothetical protein
MRFNFTSLNVTDKSIKTHAKRELKCSSVYSEILIKIYMYYLYNTNAFCG